MKKIIICTAIAILAVSCNKNQTEKTENQDSASVVQDSSSIKNTMQVSTFALPAEINDCSCFFGKNEEDLKNKQYVYADDYGNNAYLKIDDQMVKLPMEEGDFDPSDLSKVIKNENYTVTITVKKIREEKGLTIFSGEMKVESKDGKSTTTSIVGQCSC